MVAQHRTWLPLVFCAALLVTTLLAQHHSHRASLHVTAVKSSTSSAGPYTGLASRPAGRQYAFPGAGSRMAPVTGTCHCLPTPPRGRGFLSAFRNQSVTFETSPPEGLAIGSLWLFGQSVSKTIHFDHLVTEFFAALACGLIFGHSWPAPRRILEGGGRSLQHILSAPVTKPGSHPVPRGGVATSKRWHGLEVQLPPSAPLVEPGCVSLSPAPPRHFCIFFNFKIQTHMLDL